MLTFMQQFNDRLNAVHAKCRICRFGRYLALLLMLAGLVFWAGAAEAQQRPRSPVIAVEPPKPPITVGGRPWSAETLLLDFVTRAWDCPLDRLQRLAWWRDDTGVLVYYNHRCAPAPTAAATVGQPNFRIAPWVLRHPDESARDVLADDSLATLETLARMQRIGPRQDR